MNQSAHLLHGWFTEHTFFRFDRSRFAALAPSEQGAVKECVKKWWYAQQLAQDQGVGSFGVFEMLGHKAELLFLTLRSDLEALALEQRKLKGAFLDMLQPTTSFLGVVELSNYVVKSDRMHEDPVVAARLRPILPKTRHVCFYPMNKKREVGANWYLEPMEERQRMMRSHGLVGRKHAPFVTQIISGAIGLDDYEWGVSLFADDPLAFKNVVTEMRFDEVSARFAEFGAFYVGNRLTEDALIDYLSFVP